MGDGAFQLAPTVKTPVLRARQPITRLPLTRIAARTEIPF